MDNQEKRVETEEKSEEKSVEQAKKPSNDSLRGGRDYSFERLFLRDLEKLLLHDGKFLLTTRDLQLELKKKLWGSIMWTRTARRLEVRFLQGDFEMRTWLPHLAKVFDAEIYVTTFAKFRATFLNTSFKIRRTLFFKFSPPLRNFTAEGVESVLQFVDEHNDGIEFIDFDLSSVKVVEKNFPWKKVFGWLKTQRYRFANFVVSYGNASLFEEALSLVLEDGVPGMGNDTVLALRIFDGWMGLVNVMRIISDKRPITISETTAIYQQFRDALHDAPESMQPSWAMNPETFGFKQQFSKEKNLIYLIIHRVTEEEEEKEYEDDFCLLVKFEPIQAPIVPVIV